MAALYIGGQKNKSKGSLKYKVYFLLILFLVTIAWVLKLSAPLIIESWINKNGANTAGYAFSVRDADTSLAKGRVTLKDVKVFNPKTSSRLLETPNLVVQLDWSELLLSQHKNVSITADKVDLFLSKDFSSEMERIQALNETKNDLYLNALEAKLGHLNIIEQKENQSRTLLALNDVNVKVKEISLLSINKKSEFALSSVIANGGKLNLTGKTHEGNGDTPWSVHGSIKQVPANFFNKIAGDKLPFSFNESHLDAEVTAYSDRGSLIGEIAPDIKRLNLIQEKPGIPTQTIARALNNDLTFTLPFTLKDELTMQYSETFQKLKAYRKYPAAVASSEPVEAKPAETEKPKKSFSFWSF